MSQISPFSNLFRVFCPVVSKHRLNLKLLSKRLPKMCQNRSKIRKTHDTWEGKNPQIWPFFLTILRVSGTPFLTYFWLHFGTLLRDKPKFEPHLGPRTLQKGFQKWSKTMVPGKPKIHGPRGQNPWSGGQNRLPEVFPRGQNRLPEVSPRSNLWSGGQNRYQKRSKSSSKSLEEVEIRCLRAKSMGH